MERNLMSCIHFPVSSLCFRGVQDGSINFFLSITKISKRWNSIFVSYFSIITPFFYSPFILIHSTLHIQTYLKLACSSEFGFWELNKRICSMDKTECGSIPPAEDSSFLSSSSFSSKPEDPRQRRFTDLTPAFCSV